MKRAVPSDGGGSRKAERPKRTKTQSACSSCKKHKTRCEPSSEIGDSRCHRCRVLGLSCSFEASDVMLDSPLLPLGMMPRPEVGVIRDRAGVHTEGSSAPPVLPSFNASTVTPDDIMEPARPVNDKTSTTTWVCAEPMRAMIELMRRKRTTAPVDPELYPMTGEILTQEQIHHLVDIFEEHYIPWLNLPPSRTPASAQLSLSDFLTLARCAVTCRHLSPSVFAAAQPRLQRLAEHALLLRTFDPTVNASVEAVQALLILAMWAPAVGPLAAEVGDGALIAAGAVRMALALRLDQASERAVMIRAKTQKTGALTDDEREEYLAKMQKARLWASVCNVEWQLTMGMSRAPISTRSAFDHQATDWRLFPGSGTIQDARDFRLGISAQLFEATHRGLAIKCTNLNAYFAEINEVLRIFDYARNVILPLQFTFPHERVHMDVLMCTQYCGRLLVLFHALAQLRAATGTHTKEKAWFVELEKSGFSVVKTWGVEGVNVSQTVLGSFFDLIDRYGHCYSKSPHASSPPVNEHYAPPVLSTAPDSIFAIVLYAASCLLVARYTMFLQLNIRDPVFMYTAEALPARLVDSLDSLAVSDNHAARRAAAAVRQLQEVWREKVVNVVSGSNGKSNCDVTLGQNRAWSEKKYTGYLLSDCSLQHTDTDGDVDADSDTAEPRTAGISLPVSAERESAAALQTAPALGPLPFPAGPGPLFDPGFDAFSVPTLGYGGGTPWAFGAPEGNGRGPVSGSSDLDGLALPDSDGFWASFMANLATPPTA